MQDEQTWMSGQDSDESMAKERYEYFTRPEPRDNMSEIYYENDEYLGKAKCRDLSIGMVRNASEENKKVVKAYLEPFPHIRIDNAKPLQGWYQSLVNASKQSRPRPCFTEAILTEPYGGYCAVGCQFSLPAGELVDAINGGAPIERFQVGDLVWGRSNQGRCLTRVLGTTKHWKPEGLVVITVSDGRILRMTGDHPVYSVSRGWINAESLTVGEGLEDVSMSSVFSTPPQRKKMVQTLLVDLQSTPKSSSIQDMQGLRGQDQEIEVGLRRVQLENQVLERVENDWQGFTYSGASQVGGHQGQDVRLCGSEQGEYVGTGQGSQVCRIQKSSRGRRAERQGRVPSLEAPSVYGSTRKNLQHAIRLGVVNSEIPRRQQLQLGLRTNFNLPPVGSRLRAGFQNRSKDLRGSQRLHDRKREGENTSGPKHGTLGHNPRPKSVGESRHPYVEKITRVPGGVWVHDIETETGNFYQRGILVHNCYINSGMRGYRGTGLISVPLNYGEQIKHQLTKMRRSAAGYFSSFTDPFTPLEDYYHNTQRAAEEFVAVGLPIFFLSRLKYPEWAVDLLTKNPHSYAQKSINTCDPEDWRHLSPGALPLMDHLKDITRLKKRGIYVSIQVNPIVPGITTNDQIIKLFKMLKDAGADHVIVKFVEAAYSWAPAMVERMKKVFGQERGKAFESLFTQNIGSERTIDEEYRMKGHRLFSSYARKYGLTYATCYEYEYQRDEDGRILSKTGVSIGRKFTTADQCHGQRVPVYTRDSEHENFRPVEECPPSGCLYCASENEGEPRCRDELAGQAVAVRMAELKQPIGQGKARTLELPVVPND